MKKLLFTLGLVCIYLCVQATNPISIDFNSKKQDTEKISLTDESSFIVTIVNFDMRSTLKIDDEMGRTILITSQSKGYKFDSKNKRLLIPMKVRYAKLIFGDKDTLSSGNIEFSRNGIPIKVLLIQREKPNKKGVGSGEVLKGTINPTGYPLIDARAIMACDSVAQCANILAAYFPVPENINTKTELEAALKKLDNKFLSSREFIAFTETLNEKIAKAIGKGDDKPISPDIASVLTSVGGLDVTTLADGFAKFMVKRTKQELSVAFFDNFKRDLEKCEDLRIIFPQTSRTLSAMGDEIYMYELYLQTLRESFEKDLAALPTGLRNLITENDSYFEDKHELKAGLFTALTIADGIQNHEHPGMIIENINETDWDITPNIKAALQTLKIFSMSLKGNNDSTYWASPTEIKELLKNETLLNIYMGLIVQKAKKELIRFDVRNGDKNYLHELLNSKNTSLNDCRNYIRDISGGMQLIESKINSGKMITNDSLRFENYYSIVSSSIGLMKTAVQIEKLHLFRGYSIEPHGQRETLSKMTEPYFDLAQKAADLVIDVNRRNYSSAIINTVSILNTAFEIEKDKDQPTKKKYSIISTDLIKYGTFMSAVATAKNSEEVSKAIEAVALPTGSSRIKRESVFNVSLNAYCGIYYGYEKIKRVDQGQKDINFNLCKWNSYGLTAPIGFSINSGRQHILPFTSMCRFDGHWSHSLFFSVLDIGALAAFRFNSTNDTVATVPRINLKDIISPGIFYSIGIPRSPVSINLGYQVGPLLRVVEASGNSLKNEKYSRFSISVCVDIPLLNLYNKSH